MTTEKFIDIDGHAIFYRATGTGKPVVLLHGFAEDNTIWNDQVAALEANYRIIVPDLPGSGRSTLQATTSMESLADAIQLVLQEELPNHEPVTMIGHSMGGYVALAFAEKYPAGLSAMGLFHSTAYADNEEKKETRQKGIEFMLQHGAALFIQQTTPNMFSPGFKKEHPEVIKEIVERYATFSTDSLVAYYQAMMARPDRTAVLKSFPGPVLFLAGEFDNAIPLDHVLQQSYLPGISHIHILTQSGHMGMQEETTQSNQWLSDFLK